MANLLFCDLWRRRRERKFRTNTQFEINDFTDKELRARYRFRRASILFIANLVAGDINHNNRWNHALLPLHQVLIALWFYPSEGFLQVIGDTSVVDKSTVSHAITNVSRALTAKQPCFIKWPLTHDECEILKTNFTFAEDFLALLDVWMELTWDYKHPHRMKATMSTEKVLISSMYKVFATMKVSRLFAIAELPEENKNVNI